MKTALTNLHYSCSKVLWAHFTAHCAAWVVECMGIKTTLR